MSGDPNARICNYNKDSRNKTPTELLIDLYWFEDLRSNMVLLGNS